MSGRRRAGGIDRLRNALFAAYVVCCASATTWPVYDWLGNRIEPFVFGVPWSLAWVVAWVLLTFVALLAYHLSGGRTRGPVGG